MSGQFPIGTPVYLLQCVRYQVMVNTPATRGATHRVWSGMVPLVDGVEDMQITHAP